jgi:hypothetical protein
MTSKNARGNNGASCIRCFLLVGALVGATLFHVWQKVEMARVAGGVNTAQHQLVELGKQRSKLLAGIAILKKPDLIAQVAISQFGMIYPLGNPAGN